MPASGRRLTIALSASLALAIPTVAADATGTPNDTTEARARLEHLISEFHATWQTAWKQSEDFRNIDRVRPHFSTLCRLDIYSLKRAPEILRRATKAYRDSLIWYIAADSQFPIIKSKKSNHVVCPWWMVGTTVQVQDESRWRDGALLPQSRQEIFQARAELLRIWTALRNSARTTIGWSGSRYAFDWINANTTLP